MRAFFLLFFIIIVLKNKDIRYNLIKVKTIYDISCYIFFRRRSDNMNKYYLGLDMGSASVGWAVTDEN